MDWQLDSYRSSHLPDWTLHALEVQIANTERENYWLILERQYSEGWLNRLKWRLLTQKGAALPRWARLMPDFVQQLRNQVSEELLSNLVYEDIRRRSDLMLHLPPVRRL